MQIHEKRRVVRLSVFFVLRRPHSQRRSVCASVRLPSVLSACVGLCLPVSAFVCVSFVCLRHLVRVCLSRLSVCLFAVSFICLHRPLSMSGLLFVCRQPCLLVSALSACGGLSACVSLICLRVCLCQPYLPAAACLPLVPIPLSGALCAPSNGGRNGRWRRLRFRGPMPKGAP